MSKGNHLDRNGEVIANKRNQVMVATSWLSKDCQ